MDLSHTVIPKSDQLNADDIFESGKIIKITDVRVLNSPDQPVFIEYEGGKGRPWKPCKSMRRVLIKAWGTDGKKYIGKSALLFRDDKVKWAGQEVGGIRIKALSDIDAPFKMALTITRGSRRPYEVDVLSSSDAQKGADTDLKAKGWARDKIQAIEAATSKEEVLAIFDPANPAKGFLKLKETYPALFADIEKAVKANLSALEMEEVPTIVDEIPDDDEAF